MDNQPSTQPTSPLGPDVSPTQPPIPPTGPTILPSEQPQSPVQPETPAIPPLASTPIRPSNQPFITSAQTPDPEEGQKKKSNVKVVIIILIVVSLPIIALICLMCFVALPNMQRAQADTSRRNSYSQISVLVTQYMTKHSGSLPPVGTLSLAELGNSTLKDPSGSAYNVQVIECTSSNNCPGTPKLNVGQVYIVKQAGCSDGALITTSSSRNFAVVGYLASGAGIYCMSST